VRFFLFPPSARWTLDGNPLPDTNLFETELPVGSNHTVEAYTLPNNSCCETPHQHAFTVQPAKGTEPQEVTVSMKLIPGKLQVQGPAGLYFLCTHFGDQTLRPVGHTYSIRIPNLLERGKCFLRDGPKVLGEREVLIRAGQPTVLVW
jgi:hypothetical protein